MFLQKFLVSAVTPISWSATQSPAVRSGRRAGLPRPGRIFHPRRLESISCHVRADSSDFQPKTYAYLSRTHFLDYFLSFNFKIY